MKKLRLVTPIFNDWLPFNMLLRELDEIASSLPVRIAVSSIDDGSTDLPQEGLGDRFTLNNLECVEIVHHSARDTRMGNHRVLRREGKVVPNYAEENLA